MSELLLVFTYCESMQGLQVSLKLYIFLFHTPTSVAYCIQQSATHNFVNGEAV